MIWVIVESLLIYWRVYILRYVTNAIVIMNSMNAIVITNAIVVLMVLLMVSYVIYTIAVYVACCVLRVLSFAH